MQPSNEQTTATGTDSVTTVTVHIPEVNHGKLTAGTKNNGGLVQMILPFHFGDFYVPAVHFQGCTVSIVSAVLPRLRAYNYVRLPRATWWLKWGLFGGWTGLEERNTQKVELLEANVLSKFHLRVFC